MVAAALGERKHLMPGGRQQGHDALLARGRGPVVVPGVSPGWIANTVGDAGVRAMTIKDGVIQKEI